MFPLEQKKEDINGFYITPSGVKYSVLKPKDIVFVSLKGRFDKKKKKPSSEWRFHQDIYVNKKDAKAIVHAHSTCATAVSTHKKKHTCLSLHGWSSRWK